MIDFTKIAKNTITLLANRNISYISCLVDMFFTLWLLVQIHNTKTLKRMITIEVTHTFSEIVAILYPFLFSLNCTLMDSDG